MWRATCDGPDKCYKQSEEDGADNRCKLAHRKAVQHAMCEHSSRHSLFFNSSADEMHCRPVTVVPRSSECIPRAAPCPCPWPCSSQRSRSGLIRRCRQSAVGLQITYLECDDDYDHVCDDDEDVADVYINHILIVVAILVITIIT